MMVKLPEGQQRILDAMRANNGRLSISTGWKTGVTHITDRRGFRGDSRSWTALRRKGLVRYSGEWDNIGQWYIEGVG